MRKAAILCGAVLLFGVSLPAMAQQPFEDVPRDHWAYQAVQTLQERGVVIGYPDGTFGGKRAMTRYEFAVAIQRLLVDIIDKHQEGGPGVAGITREELDRILEDYARKSDLEGLARRDEIPDVSDVVRRGDIENFVTREDIQNIQRLVDEFRDELASMGTDVQNLRRDLDALKSRVSAIEDRLNRWRMSGEASAIVRGDRFSDAGGGLGRIGTDLDNRVDLNTQSSLLENLRFFYDLNLGITGKPTSGITANALFNYGNYLPWAGANRAYAGVGGLGSISGPHVGANAQAFGPLNQGNLGSDGNNGNAQITPLILNIEGAVGNLGPLRDISGTLGKFGHQYTPYTLKLVDPDSYTYLPYTDNGDILMTGAKMNAHIGKLMLSGYAAKHENGGVLGLLNEQGYGYPVGTTVGGPTNLNPYSTVGALWDQSAGGRATFDLGRIRLGATYLEGGVNRNSSIAPVSTIQPRKGWVLGGDISIDIFSRLRFDGEFASSNLLGNFAGNDREGIYPLDRRNAWDGKLSYGLGRLSLAVGYKQVDPLFGAPGFWGAIGRWKNPTNIKGINGSIGYNFGEKLSLQGMAEFYNSLLTRNNVIGITDEASDGIQHFQVGLKYNLTSANRVDLGWEQARYHPNGAGVSLENYYNIGLGHSFNDNTSLKLLYQIIDYNAGTGISAMGVPSYKGSVAVGQFSVKF